MIRKALVLAIMAAFFTISGFAQRAPKTMDRQAAERAMGMVRMVGGEIPQIPGAALVVETEPNGFGRKVWLAVSQPGAYLLQGTTCGGGISTPLGAVYWESLEAPTTLLVIDTAKSTESAPFREQICSVDVYRTNGILEKLGTYLYPLTTPSTSTPIVQVLGEGVTVDGKYYVNLYPLPHNATVMLGRWMLAEEIFNSPFGARATFTEYGELGAVTLTVCSGGICRSAVFEKKVTVARDGKG